MSLQYWFPLTDNTNNQGESNIIMPTSVGSDVTSSTAGKIGNCYAFNGSNNGYIQFPLTFGASQSVSFAFWFKLNNNTANHCFFSCRNAASAAGIAIFYIPNSGIRFDDGASLSMNEAINAGEWHHCACCKDSTNKTYIYIDGALKASGDGHLVSPNETYSYIGKSQQNASNTNFNNYLNGYLNDYRIYDHCLSAEEVREIANGLVLHYPLNTYQYGYGNPNILNNSKTLGTGFSGTGTITQNVFEGFAAKYRDNTNGTGYSDTLTYSNAVTVNPDEIYTVSFWAKADTTLNFTCYFYNNTSGAVQCAYKKASNGFNGTSGADGNITLIATTEWQYYWITWTFGSTGTAIAKSLILGRLAKETGGLYIAAPKLEKGAAHTPWAPSTSDGTGIFNIISDESGYHHHATVVNSPTFEPSAARYSAALHFSATNQYATVAGLNTAAFGTTYTFTWWGKCATWSNKMFWGFSNGIRLNGIYNGILWNTGDGSNNPLYKPGTTTAVTAPTINEWHHFAMVADGSTCKVYQDGELWGQAKTFKQISGTSLFLNGWDAGTTYSNSDASISDFRIYCTALSDTEILKLYNSSMIFDNIGGIHTYSFEDDQASNITLSKTGIVSSPVILEENNINNSNIQIGKDSYPFLWADNITVTSTNTGHIISQPYSDRYIIIKNINEFRSYSGKTLRLSYDISVPGTRKSTENNTTGSSVYYGVDLVGTYSRTSGSPSSPRYCTSQLSYSGENTRIVQTMTLPTLNNAFIYAALRIELRTSDQPASTNNNTWSISNIRVELIDNNLSQPWINGIELIEK